MRTIRCLALLAGLSALLAGCASRVVPTPVTAVTAVGESEQACLARTIYHEARGEPQAGRLAVAHVVLNRRGRPGFKPTVCGTVQQRAHRAACQFSFVCNGRKSPSRNNEAYMRSRQLAAAVLAGETQDPTGGALYFHAREVRPGWAKRMQPATKIGRHQFYKPRGQ